MRESARHIESFLDMLAAERGAAPNTLEAYRRDLEDYAGFLSQRRVPLPAAATQDIIQYLGSLAEAGLSPASRARKLSALRQLYKFLSAEDIVADDPAAGLSGPKRRCRCRRSCRSRMSTA